MNALVGIKAGMSRMFDDNGASTAISVIDMSGNRICQVKKSAAGKDGYDSIQIAHGSRKKKSLSNAAIGHLAKHKAGLARRLVEVRCTPERAAAANPGDEIGLSEFSEGSIVDVSGISKGKGFAGVIRRHNFRSNRASHGNSKAHNKPGSTGQCQDPGKVFKGKKMPGHLGAKRATVKNLRVMRVDMERSILYVAGGIPGASNGEVLVRLASRQPSTNGGNGKKAKGK